MRFLSLLVLVGCSAGSLPGGGASGGGAGEGGDPQLPDQQTESAESGGQSQLASSPFGPMLNNDGNGDDIDTGEIDPDEQADIAVTLTDAPGDYEAVPVTISSVYAMLHDEESEDTGDSEEEEGADRVVLVDEATEWDLLQLQDGVTGLLGEASVDAARFSQIRMVVSEAAVVVDGEEIPLEIPSGEQTGIKIPYDFMVEAGGDYELRLDFDAHESIAYRGGKYRLSPVVKVDYFGPAAAEAGKDTGM